VVGVDGEKLHALALVFFVEPLKATLDAVRRGAVIGSEEHHEGLAAGVIGELMLPAVDAKQFEIGSGIAALERPQVGGVAVDEAGGVGAMREDGGEDGQAGKEGQEALHGE